VEFVKSHLLSKRTGINTSHPILMKSTTNVKSVENDFHNLTVCGYTLRSTMENRTSNVQSVTRLSWIKPIWKDTIWEITATQGNDNLDACFVQRFLWKHESWKSICSVTSEKNHIFAPCVQIHSHKVELSQTVTCIAISKVFEKGGLFCQLEDSDGMAGKIKRFRRH